MPPQIRLGTRQINDLAQIRDLPVEILTALDERLRTASPIRAQELHREITDVLGADRAEIADDVMRPLLGLQSLIRQNRIPPDEAVKGVRKALESHSPKWDDRQFERWNHVEPVFQRMISAPAVRRVSVTLDLMYEYENLLQSARVVTDIRPVFNDEATVIEGAVISHTLRIRYDSAEGDHSLSLAMDETDLRELQKQCQRAIQKAAEALRLMTDGAKVRAVISGTVEADDA
jgi:hypothetical protein